MRGVRTRLRSEGSKGRAGTALLIPYCTDKVNVEGGNENGNYISCGIGKRRTVDKNPVRRREDAKRDNVIIIILYGYIIVL